MIKEELDNLLDLQVLLWDIFHHLGETERALAECREHMQGVDSLLEDLLEKQNDETAQHRTHTRGTWNATGVTN